MTRPTPAVRRAGILRLVVVLAALVGIALIQSGHCQASAPMDMSMTAAAAAAGHCGPAQAGADQGMNHADHDHGAVMFQTDAAPVTTGSDQSPPAVPAGIVMACLAVFLALLAGVALLRSHWRACAIRLPLPLAGPEPRAVLPRPPSLAELCVLRT
ncbi:MULTISPECIES: hypothetical protein [Nocardia]|uniref:hypothetical protein n=1 Tax=Nocardia TaxID=1817 RepID=UPI0012FBDB12|nr:MULTISPECIES: hypothetical protein [Nocardia]